VAALGALRVAAADVGRASAAGEGPAVAEVIHRPALRAGDEVPSSAVSLHADPRLGSERGLKDFPSSSLGELSRKKGGEVASLPQAKLSYLVADSTLHSTMYCPLMVKTVMAQVVPTSSRLMLSGFFT